LAIAKFLSYTAELWWSESSVGGELELKIRAGIAPSD
jgi:hypothetical protein